MVSVTYSHQFGYLTTGDRGRFPGFLIQVQNPTRPALSVEVDAHLDSGAERSLFDGWIARSIGLDLLGGPVRRYAPTQGLPLEARIHHVVLVQPILGTFSVEVGFSTE